MEDGIGKLRPVDQPYEPLFTTLAGDGSPPA
jgi:hypothetical protein